MKQIILASLIFSLAIPALAYNPISVEPPEPYEVIMIEGDPYVQREYLGDLEDYPDMYEFTTDVTMDLKVRLRQRDSKKSVPFGLIMVRQNDGDGGVTEVVRQNEPVAEWDKVKEPTLGIKLIEGNWIEKNIEPGTYRIEVSTPDNKGNYMFIVGEEAEPAGFFATFAHIFKIQLHFGYTPFRMLLSSYVYYTLGILGVLYGIYRTWRYRKELQNGHTT